MQNTTTFVTNTDYTGVVNYIPIITRWRTFEINADTLCFA